jgi:hypothetical protein
MTVEIDPTRPGGHLSTAEPSAISTSEPSVRFFNATLILLALSVLIVCLGYALSRSSEPGALTAYYVGEFMTALMPVVFILKNKNFHFSIGAWLSITIGISTFIIAYCYSPMRFPLSDEYQHMFTAQAILTSHHLFGYNPTLPVSPQFPGLEIVTSALSSVSGLSIFVCGTIVAGICHVLLTGLVFFLGRALGLSSRAALIGVIIFTTGYDYQSFLSYFIYETFALPFFVATLILFIKSLRADSVFSKITFSIGTVVVAFVTIVSHHVTSYLMTFLIVMLGLFAIPSFRRKEQNLWLIILPVVSIVGLLLFWDLAVATDTLHYLGQIKSDLSGAKGVTQVSLLPSQQVVAHVASGSGQAPSGITAPPLRIIGDMGIVIFAVILAIGSWTVWRNKSSYPRSLWMAPMVAGIGYFALLPIFVFSSNGVGLVGRAQVLLLIPAGMLAAAGLERVSYFALSGQHTKQRARRLRYAGAALGLSLVAAGGVPASYPPSTGKLPSPFNDDAYTRSADAHTIETGEWISRTLGPTARLAADHSSQLLFEAIGGVPAIQGIANLFESETFSSADARLVRRLKIGYVVADQRLTTEVPAGDSNFDDDPLSGGYKEPLPASTLTKFDHLSGVSRIFDDGVIVIYALEGSPLDKKSNT